MSTNTLWNRREFVIDSAALGLAAAVSSALAAEPPPETTRIRLAKVRSACFAPQYLAEELLRVEGFSAVEYVPFGAGVGGLSGAHDLGAGRLDMTISFAAPLTVGIDRGAPIVLLAGIHAGCFELFARPEIRTISDLKGKTINVLTQDSAQRLFLASIATSVGLDPDRDFRWAANPPAEAKRLFAEGKLDAFLGFPPDPQELRANNVGHVVLNSAVDRPWSQYYCCMVAANREFAQKNPVATKRALRAIIKASEICAVDPDRGARAFLDRHDDAAPRFAQQAVREIPARARGTQELAPIPGQVRHVFNSFFSCSSSRQSVPCAISFCGALLTTPASRSRSA